MTTSLAHPTSKQHDAFAWYFGSHAYNPNRRLLLPEYPTTVKATQSTSS